MIKQPLADLARPVSFDDVVGDPKLFGTDGIFRKMTATGHIPNMIFFGASGTGKTTAANIIARSSGKTLYKLNATTAGIADVKAVVEDTATLLGTDGILLYLDEIQYFNKKQQQTLLEYIEDGRITLISSTTENPYMYVYPAIISRSAVFEFKPLSKNDIMRSLKRAEKILSENIGRPLNISDDAMMLIATASAGDARRALNLLENVSAVCPDKITENDVRTFLPDVMGMSGIDKSGDGHYDLLSAFHKSVRGSDADAAVFYLAKLLSGGDLLSVCRRLQCIASEDIGLAYPQAIAIVRACVESARELGLPEAVLPLVNATVLLATAPKSNSAYLAYHAAADDISSGLGNGFPRAVQNTHLDGENADVRGQNYKYPHDYPDHYIPQQYMPNDIKDRVYYHYGDNKTEQLARQYWDKIKNR
ncbi:MAG: replication-associated recombination protein A [Clostridia bacterium]|nr:replication-associated recombination protein A [Clostridia bacterium]